MSTIIGVCSSSMLKNEIQTGEHNQKSKNVGYCLNAASCVPADQLISGDNFAVSGNSCTVQLTLDMNNRSLTIKHLRTATEMVLKIPDEKIYPWVKLQQSPYGEISCKIVE